MKFSLATLALTATLAATASAKAPKHHELTADYSFDSYVVDFGKQAYSDEEMVHRKAIFEKNVKDIMKHNAQKNVPFKKGINEFTDLEHHEGHFGYAKSGHDAWTGGGRKLAKGDYSELPFTVDDVSTLPKHVDWRDRANTVTAVKDQGGCGSCWAFAAAATLESHIAIQTGTLFNLAPQEFVSCMENPEKCGGEGGCAGATVDLAFEYMMEHGGIVQEYQMGYSSYYGENGECTIETDIKDPLHLGKTLDGPDPKGITTGVANIEKFVKIPTNDYKALMNAIAKTGPVAVSVAASPWKAYESGVFVMPGDGFNDPTNLDVNHAVTLTGYGTDEATGLDYFLIRNSWKPTWAEDGYIRILRQDPDALEEGEICGDDMTPLHGTACEGFVGNVTVCGTSAILFDNVIPVGGYLLV